VLKKIIHWLLIIAMSGLLAIAIYTTVSSTGNLELKITPPPEIITAPIALTSPKAVGKTEMLNVVVRLKHLAGLGSGVLIYRERTVRNIRYVYYVITNEHVVASRFATKLNVDGARKLYGMVLADPGVTIRVFSNAVTEWKEYDGEVIAESPENDLALIKFQTSDYLPNITMLTDTEAVSQTEIFDSVYAVGCQLGELSIPTEGIVSGFIFQNNLMLIIHTAHVLPGSSGGGLFKKHDGQYHLIGLPSAIRRYNFQLIPHYSYAVSAEMIYRFLHENDMSFIYENGMVNEV